MKREIVFTVFLALATVGFMGCQKDETGKNGPSTLGVKIEAANKSYSLPVVSTGTKSAATTTASITWDTVQMVVSTIKFEAELKSLITHEDSVEISYKWIGPKTVNLFDSSLVLGSFILQPGFYDEIELKVTGEKKDAVNKPVFYMYGKYNNSDGATIPVAIRVNEDLMFKTENDSVTVTEESIDITSYIKLFLDKLMESIDPAALDDARLTNGVIVISSASNSNMYKTILRNLLKDHYCYYEDNNDKGKGKGKNKNKKYDDD